MERVPIKSEPKLFDNVIAEIQQGLANNLMWLNFSFGKAERLVKQINGRKYYTPNVYLGKNEYVLIAPDSGLGNFSFFVLDEPQDVEWAIGDRTHLSTPSPNPEGLHVLENRSYGIRHDTKNRVTKLRKKKEEINKTKTQKSPRLGAQKTR